MNRPTPLTDKFLHDLRERMEQLKVNQVKLAHDMKTTKQHVWCWFNGKRRPSAEYILSLQQWMKDKI